MALLFSVMLKEFRHVLRDPWALGGATMGPVLLMALFAYAVSADIENIPVAVFDGDRTPRSRAYLQSFANDTFFDLKYGAESCEEARDRVLSGQARGAIIVPPGFADALASGEQVSVQVIVDGSEPNTALQVRGNAEAISTGFSVGVQEERLMMTGPASGGGTQLLEFRNRVLYNPELKELNTFLPGMMSIVLAFPALFAALSLVKEKEYGSMEGLVATPIHGYHLVIGKAIPYLLIGMLDILFLTLVGVVMFGVPFRGGMADMFVLSVLFLLANLGIGLLLSSVLRTQMMALIVGSLTFMLPLMQAGLLTPFYAMSRDAQLQAMAWPATHYIIICRGIFLKGVGWDVLMPHGLFLLAYGVLLNALAVWRLKKKVS